MSFFLAIKKMQIVFRGQQVQRESVFMTRNTRGKGGEHLVKIGTKTSKCISPFHIRIKIIGQSRMKSKNMTNTIIVTIILVCKTVYWKEFHFFRE